MEFMIVKTDADLTHYGVLGQKWGVRRYQNEDGSLTALGKRRASGADFDGDTVDEKGNVRLRSVFRRSDGKREVKKDPKLEYYDPGSGSIEKELEWHPGTSGEITLSNGGSNATKKINYEVDKNRKITFYDAETKKKTTLQKEVDDGWDDIATMTKKGASSLNQKSGDLQTAQNVLSNATNVAQKLNNITTRNAKSRTAEIRSNIDLSHVTDSDLKAMVNRLNMEKQYKDLTMDARNIGKKTLSDTLATVGDVLAVGASAAAILVAINQIKKKS